MIPKYTVDAQGYLLGPSGRMLAAIDNMGGDVAAVETAADLILKAPTFPRIKQR